MTDPSHPDPRHPDPSPTAETFSHRGIVVRCQVVAGPDGRYGAQATLVAADTGAGSEAPPLARLPAIGAAETPAQALEQARRSACHWIDKNA